MRVQYQKSVSRSTDVELPLRNGDHLTQAEFHRRYEKCPPGIKAELIGGIVYMPSPTGFRHSDYHLELGLIVRTYKAFTVGTESGIEPTTILDIAAQPQPDIVLRLLPDFRGQSRVNAKQFLVGAPEFVAEIAQSSVAIDLGRKKDDYERSGVQEYLVLCIEEQELQWFHFPSRRKLKADKNGIWKSKVFPGLWIDEKALLARDSAQSIEVVQMGLGSREHVDFVERLERIRKKAK